MAAQLAQDLVVSKVHKSTASSTKGPFSVIPRSWIGKIGPCATLRERFSDEDDATLACSS